MNVPLQKEVTLGSRRSARCFGNRRGLTMIETIVSASILLVVMSMVLSLTFRIGQVWRDTTHQRLAMNELSNQLDELTRLSPEDVSTQLRALKPSSSIQRALDEPALRGELVDDDFGKRVVLSLQWKQQHPTRGVELVGWLVDWTPKQTKNENDEGGEQ